VDRWNIWQKKWKKRVLTKFYNKSTLPKSVVNLYGAQKAMCMFQLFNFKMFLFLLGPYSMKFTWCSLTWKLCTDGLFLYIYCNRNRVFLLCSDSTRTYNLVNWMEKNLLRWYSGTPFIKQHHQKNYHFWNRASKIHSSSIQRLQLAQTWTYIQYLTSCLVK
jgi:hypothetical protein